MEINIIFNKINTNKRRKILNFEDENESIIQIPKTITVNPEIILPRLLCPQKILYP